MDLPGKHDSTKVPALQTGDIFGWDHHHPSFHRSAGKRGNSWERCGTKIIYQSIKALWCRKKPSRENITSATRRFSSVLRSRLSSCLCSRRQWSVASSLDFVGSYLVRLRPRILSSADFVLRYFESVCARLRRGLTLRPSLLVAVTVHCHLKR